MKRVAFCFFLSLSSIWASVTDITPDQAYAKQQEGAIVIDVRTPQEYFYIGHAPGHINVPFYFEQFSMEETEKREKFSIAETKILKRAVTPKNAFKIQQIPNDDFGVEVLKLAKSKDTALILICKAGERSKAAAHILEDKGFTNIYSVINGFSGKKDEPNNGWVNTPSLPWGK